MYNGMAGLDLKSNLFIWIDEEQGKAFALHYFQFLPILVPFLSLRFKSLEEMEESWRAQSPIFLIPYIKKKVFGE